MAVKGGTIITKVSLDDKGLKTSLDGVKKKGKRTATDIEKAWKSMGKKSDQTYDQMKAHINKNYDTIKNHAKSTADDIVRAEKAKAAKIKQINKQQFGEQKKFLDEAKQHWMVYAAAVAGFVVAGKKIITLAMEQEKAEVALSAALKANGEYTKELVKDYADFASGIQAITIYGDEEVLKLMALQKNLGVTSDNLKEATKMTIGMAAATGRDVNSMGMYIALAQQGEFTMLRRYIPALRSTTDATEQLKIITDFAARGFIVAQENAKTFSGGLSQLGNLFGDLQERIGNVVVKNQALLDLMDEGKESLLIWIGQMERWVDINGELIAQKTRETIEGITSSIKGLVATFNALPSGIVGAAGTGILVRILTGSTPIGRFAAALYLINVQLEKAGVNTKKIGEYAAIAQNPLLALKGLIPGEPSLFGGGSAGGLSGAGRGFGPVTPSAPDSGDGGDPTTYTEKQLSEFAKAGKGITDLWEVQYREKYEVQSNALTQMKEAEIKNGTEIKDFWQIQYDERYEVQSRALARMEENEKKSNKSKVEMYQTAAGNIASTFLQISQAGGQQSKEAFTMYKAFAIIQAGMAAKVAIVGALGSPPYGLGAIALASSIAAMTAVQIGMLASAKPPSYDEGGISSAKGIYQTGNIDEAHIPLKGGKVPVKVQGSSSPSVIIHMDNPTFQDVATQRQVFMQLAEIVAKKVAPGAVVQDYSNDGQIRQMIRGRL